LKTPSADADSSRPVKFSCSQPPLTKPRAVAKRIWTGDG